MGSEFLFDLSENQISELLKLFELDSGSFKLWDKETELATELMEDIVSTFEQTNHIPNNIVYDMGQMSNIKEQVNEYLKHSLSSEDLKEYLRSVRLLGEFEARSVSANIRTVLNATKFIVIILSGTKYTAAYLLSLIPRLLLEVQANVYKNGSFINTPIDPIRFKWHDKVPISEKNHLADLKTSIDKLTIQNEQFQKYYDNTNAPFHLLKYLLSSSFAHRSENKYLRISGDLINRTALPYSFDLPIYIRTLNMYVALIFRNYFSILRDIGPDSMRGELNSYRIPKQLVHLLNGEWTSDLNENLVKRICNRFRNEEDLIFRNLLHFPFPNKSVFCDLIIQYVLMLRKLTEYLDLIKRKKSVPDHFYFKVYRGDRNNWGVFNMRINSIAKPLLLTLSRSKSFNDYLMLISSFFSNCVTLIKRSDFIFEHAKRMSRSDEELYNVNLLIHKLVCQQMDLNYKLSNGALKSLTLLSQSAFCFEGYNFFNSLLESYVIFGSVKLPIKIINRSEK